jgi:hypothetical protein
VEVTSASTQLAAAGRPLLADMAQRLAAAATSAQQATDWLLAPARDADEQLAVATPYAELLATTFAAALLGKGAWAAAAGDGASPQCQRQIQIARFYFHTILPQAGALAHNIVSGGGALLSMQEQWLKG